MQLNFKLFSTTDVGIYCGERKTKLLIDIYKKKYRQISVAIFKI